MTAESSINLRRVNEFLGDRLSLSRDAFLRKHPTPMLVLSLTPEAGELEDDGGFRTGLITSEVVKAASAEASRHTAVVPVEKRMGDAFQAFIWVGRESRCDVTLPFESVSKLQAQFVKRPSGEVELLDAGSTNGTFVDGVRLEKNKPVLLRDGAQIRFGRIETVFRSAEGFWEDLARFA